MSTVTAMRHVLHAGIVLLVVGLFACEPTKLPIAGQPATGSPAPYIAASEKFERIPDDKLDPALRRYRTEPWNLKKMPEFKKAFDAALAGAKVEKWVSELHLIALEGEPYQTPDGVAFFYFGAKPHEASDKNLGIAFLPAMKQLRIRIDEKCKETKYVGSSNASLVGLLQGPDFLCDRN